MVVICKSLAASLSTKLDSEAGLTNFGLSSIKRVNSHPLYLVYEVCYNKKEFVVLLQVYIRETTSSE